MFGVDRAKLMVNVRAVVKPAAGKKTRNFRGLTAAKRAEKQAAGTWCGWDSVLPKPRLGGAAAVEAATKNAATAAVRARLWIGGKARRENAARLRAGASTSSSAKTTSATAKVQTAQKVPVAVSAGTWRRRGTTSGQAPKAPSVSTLHSKSASHGSKSASASTPGAMTPFQAYQNMAVAAKFAKRNEYVVSTSLEAMVRQRSIDPDSAALASWLRAVAQGGLLRCSGKRMALQPGVQSGHHVQMSTDFLTKHHSLADAMHTAAKKTAKEGGL